LIARAVAGEPIGEDAALVTTQSVHILVCLGIQKIPEQALQHVGRVFARRARVGLVRIAGVQVDDLDLVLIEVVAVVLQRIAVEVREEEIEPHLGAS